MRRKTISNWNISGSCNGLNSQEIGRTNIKLNKLEPKTLPITISECPFRTKITVETSSGNDVPKATANRDRKVVDNPNINEVFISE